MKIKILSMYWLMIFDLKEASKSKKEDGFMARLNWNVINTRLKQTKTPSTIPEKSNFLNIQKRTPEIM